jgi:hypothetical protein
MRSRALPALVLAVAASACAPRAQPYRFSMPMLGQADVPAETLRTQTIDPEALPAKKVIAHATATGGAPRPKYAYGWQTDAQSGIRTVSARGIELKQPEASAETAAAVISESAAARPEWWAHLPAPHRSGSAGVTGSLSAATAPSRADQIRLAGAREPVDLRALVGTRDKREPFAIAMEWLAGMGITFAEGETAVEMAASVVQSPTDGPALVEWARSRGKLLAPTDTPVPGDVLVFDRATTGDAADLVAVVIGRDARSVLEYMYAGGGVIRRGYLDPSRPTTRRDLSGSIVNTFLRHGKKWPAKGTRYLAGELIVHVIRTR